LIELGVLEVRREDDIVRAHQTTRSVAAQLGFSGFEQTRLATAMSEIARNSLIYAGSGTIAFSLDDAPRSFSITVTDRGPGIADLDEVLRGARRRTTTGLGIPGARRLMDALTIESTRGSTRVVMQKRLPRTAARFGSHVVAEVRARIVDHAADDPYQALQRAQQDISERDVRLSELTQELHETNRGVMALYAELEERAEYQRRAAELKTRLLSEMGHELRTPLHSIVSVAQFLVDRLDGELNAEQDKQARLILEIGSKLTAYVNDLLDLSKAEAGKAPVHPSHVSIPELFGTLRRMLAPLLTSPNVELRFESPGNAGPLWTDESKLSQILRNLLANALKFTEQGYVAVRADGAGDGFIAFEVEDTGVGIASEHQELIFEEFAQIEGPHQHRVRGTGLGLALSRRLAELLGGELTVRSQLGAGSTFRVLLPGTYRGPLAAPTPVEPLKLTALIPPGPRQRVLIVDDDEPSRYVLAKWLQDRFDIEEAASGRDGLQRALASAPAAIFLDVVIPDLTGFEVLEALEAHPVTAKVPVIIYTSLSLGENDRKRLAHATAVVRKSSASRVADRSAVEQALLRAGLASGLELRHE
jgi:signal transduction histidine kinase